MPLGILYVFAKEPEPGSVKTRLCPPLMPSQAAALAEAFVADMLAAMTAGGAGLFEVRLATSPAGGGPRLAALAAQFGVVRVEQGDGDLGRRMQHVMEAGLEEAPAVALVGADVPDLPVAYVRAAFEALEASGGAGGSAGARAAGAGRLPGQAPGGDAARTPDVVLGPSTDGGYYLVGARRPVGGLFRIDAPWGSAGVLAATVARLSAAGVVYSLVPVWSDVDDAAGLALLDRRLAGEHRARCPHSAAALVSLRREGWGR